jgi:hypothetical protein
MDLETENLMYTLLGIGIFIAIVASVFYLFLTATLLWLEWGEEDPPQQE